MGSPQLAKATALLFFHRFFLRQSFKAHDGWLVGVTCLFLAGKVEETPKKLRDVIRVAYKLRFNEEPRDEKTYFQVKEQILIHERKVLQIIAFDLTVVHPYKELISMAKAVNGSNQLAQCAWNFVNDSLRMTLCLQYRPKEIAAGVLYLATKYLKMDLNASLPQPWWDIVGVPVSVMKTISTAILDMYQQHGNNLAGLASTSATGGATSGPPPPSSSSSSAAASSSSSSAVEGGVGSSSSSSSSAGPSSGAAGFEQHHRSGRPVHHASHVQRSKPY